MRPETMLQDCDHALQELLPDQSRPVQKTLAAVLCGVVRARSVVLSRLGLHLPGRATASSKQRQAQRLVANAHQAVERAQRRLLRRVLQARRGQGRVDLLLDAVVRGASAQQAGTVSLVLGLAWHRRALPLVWHTWPANQPGQDWKPVIRALVAAVQAELPPDTQVVVLVDRGLSGAELARTVQAAGVHWHFLWRVIRTTRVRQADGTVCPIGDLVPIPGRRTCLTGTALYAPRHKGGRGRGGWQSAWQSDWQQAVAANVVAVWRRGEREPWLLVTDLPATLARCAEYRRRTWEEELFRDLKRLGWQWQLSRVHAPERVQRLLLLLALATVWMVALGERLLRRGQRRTLEAGRRRRLSLFQLGLRWCEQQLDAHRPVPCLLGFPPSAFPVTKLS